jgi:NADH-quinone oxidoreductase subunit L
MTRLFVVVFLGEARSDAAKHGHDGPPMMTIPLIILGVLSVVAGWPVISHVMLGETFSHELESIETFDNALAVEIMGFLAFLVGTAGGWFLYKGRTREPLPAFPFALFKNKFYIDEIYAALIAGTQDLLASLSAWFDKWIIDGLFVRTLSGATWGTGFILRFFQIGNLQAYAFLFGLGVVGLIYYMVFA